MLEYEYNSTIDSLDVWQLLFDLKSNVNENASTGWSKNHFYLPSGFF